MTDVVWFKSEKNIDNVISYKIMGIKIIILKKQKIGKIIKLNERTIGVHIVD